MSEQGTRTSLYRLAIRQDGHTVAAYFAEQGTMQGALLMGTMSKDIAERWPETFEAFKQAMTVCLTCMRETTGEGGTVASIEQRPAPPAETSRTHRFGA